MNSIEINGIKQDSNVNRLLKTCSYEETDHVPCFEHYVMKNTIKNIYNEEQIKEIICSDDMKHLMYLLTEAESEEKFKITKEMIWQSWERDLMDWYSNSMLPPINNLEILKATGVDIATPMLIWQPWNQKLLGSKGITMDQYGLKERELKNLKVPFRKAEKMLELIDWYIKVFKGSGIGVGPLVRSCFCSTYQVLGLEKFIIKTHKDIELVKHFFDLFTEYSIMITEELSKRNIDCLWIDDDICMNQGFFINPKFIKEYWVPRTEAILKPIKKKKIPIFMHCCGNVKDLLPLIIDMGITGIQPLQPNCNNIYELKKEYEGKITFFGNIDIAGVLSFGKPKDVIEDTKKHIDHLAHGGGYVVSSSHSIVDTIPFENYIAMIQTAQTYYDYKSK